MTINYFLYITIGYDYEKQWRRMETERKYLFLTKGQIFDMKKSGADSPIRPAQKDYRLRFINSCMMVSCVVMTRALD